MMQSDLAVHQHSDSLASKVVDLVVTGSIGAIEAPRLVRALRRLGATVVPYLTPGSQMFTTETALAWAANSACVTGFSGTSSHLAHHDVCVVAPCSAHFLHEIAYGSLSSPGAALVASYLGCQKPVYLLLNMHDSLLLSPAVQANIARVRPWLTVLEARQEEGKQKFPEPKVLADTISHHLNRPKLIDSPLLVTMGTTRAYIDDVRYVSNYSSGALGSLITEEGYRQGFATTVIAGPAPQHPRCFSKLIEVVSYDDMHRAYLDQRDQYRVGIFAASVLDFVPEAKRAGKTPSGQNLTINLKPTEKLLSLMSSDGVIKVAFKLEAELSDEVALRLAQSYMTKYNLSLFVANALSGIDCDRHLAQVYTKVGDQCQLWAVTQTKNELARSLIHWLKSTLTSQPPFLPA